MNYFIVSLDFDGVLAHGLNVKRRYAKEWFGVDLNLDETKEAGFNALMRRLGKSANYRSLMDTVNERHIMEYEVPSDCIPTLRELYARNCRFVVLSSRNKHDCPFAVQFVREKFAGLVKYVHNTSNNPKSALLKRLKPCVHIDDDVSKLVDIAHLPIELVYYRQPENLNQSVPEGYSSRIREACSFGDIGRIVNQIISGPKSL